MSLVKYVYIVLEQQSAPVLVSQHSVLNLQGYTGFKWCNAMYVLAIKIYIYQTTSIMWEETVIV